MGGIIVTDPAELYWRLRDIFEEEISEDSFLSDCAHLPNKVKIYAEIDVKGQNYAICLGAKSGDLTLFSGFQERFKNQLIKRKLPWRIHPHNPDILMLKKDNEPFFDYALEYKTEESQDENEKPEEVGRLELLCSTHGLFTRTLTKQEEFVENMENMETLANILFYPLLKTGFGRSHIPFYYFAFND